MIKEKISLQEVVDLLNEILELDRPAIAALIANRIPCNKALADHPTVQVSSQHGGYHVGLLGILNGLFGIRENGYGAIMAVFDRTETDKNKMARLGKFEITPDGPNPFPLQEDKE